MSEHNELVPLELEFKSIRSSVRRLQLANDLLKSKIYTLENSLKIKEGRIKELEEEVKRLKNK